MTGELPTNEPVHVTGEERRHPAYRLLGRAMILLARLQLRKATIAEPPKIKQARDASPDVTASESAAEVTHE